MELLFERERLFFLCMILSLFLIASCGRKGNPTLYSFEKPSSVKEIKTIHRENEIVVSWSYSALEKQKVKGFYVEKAEGDGVQYKRIAFLKNNILQFADKDFKAGLQYCYKVYVISLRDVISDDSPVVRVKPGELPLPPQALSHKITNDLVRVSWNDELSAKRAGMKVYNIYKSYEKGTVPLTPLNRVPLKESFFEEAVEPEKHIYYTVRSLLDTEIRDEGYPSKEIEVGPGSFVPAKPSGLRYVPSARSVYLLWDENPETWIKGYRVYKKKAGESDFRTIGDAAVPTYKDNEPLTEKTFYYITALGPAKESSAAKMVEVDPIIEQ